MHFFQIGLQELPRWKTLQLQPLILKSIVTPPFVWQISDATPTNTFRKHHIYCTMWSTTGHPSKTWFLRSRQVSMTTVTSGTSSEIKAGWVTSHHFVPTKLIDQDPILRKWIKPRVGYMIPSLKLTTNATWKMDGWKLKDDSSPFGKKAWHIFRDKLAVSFRECISINSIHVSSLLCWSSWWFQPLWKILVKLDSIFTR